MRRLSLIVAALAFVLGACERHTWLDQDANNDGKIDQNEKGTIRLYEKHDEGGHGGHDEGDEGEHKEGEVKKEH